MAFEKLMAEYETRRAKARNSAAPSRKGDTMTAAQHSVVVGAQPLRAEAGS